MSPTKDIQKNKYDLGVSFWTSRSKEDNENGLKKIKQEK